MQHYEETPQLPRINPQPLRFDSRSEAVIANLMERYIKGWTAQMGVTIQIPIGAKRIDFLVNNSLIEFHPIFIKRDMKSSEANDQFSRLYKKYRGTTERF